MVHQFYYAGFYETASYIREWLQDQGELGSLKEELEEAVESCHTAKERLKTIEYKYSREQRLINKANLILNNDGIKSNPSLDIDTVNEYKNRLENVTIEMNPEYQAYTQYKEKTTELPIA